MLSKNQKILIVGLGLMGGSFAEGLSNNGYYVGALSEKKEDIDYALQKGIISSGEYEIKPEYIAKFDIVIFALYPHIFINWMKENQQYLKPHAIISDVTGVKKEVVNPVNSFIRKDLIYIPIHPMAGKEVYGVVNADKNIFKGANFIIVNNDNKDDDVQKIKDIANLLEFKNIVMLSVDEHDEMIGFLSQLTHCIAVSLMTCKESENLALYTGDSFRDLTRIAKINENMWCELFLMNKEKLLEQMELFSKEFNKIKEAIKLDDKETIKEMMKTSTKRRGYFDKK